MSRMEYLPTSIFRFFQLPDRPDKTDLAIAQLLSSDEELVCLDASRSEELLKRYFGRLNTRSVIELADGWIERPDRFQLWIMCSQSVGAAVGKISNLGSTAKSARFVTQTESSIFLNFDAALREHNAVEFAIRHFSKSMERSLEDNRKLTIELRKGFESLGSQLESEGLQVRYGRSHSGLIASGKRIADEPLRTSNPVLEDLFAVSAPSKVLTEIEDLASLSSLLIRKNLTDPDFSVSGLAKLLCMSPRNLLRRLAMQGVSYSSLLKQVRSQVINEKLRQGVSRERLGEFLGYTDLSSIYKFLAKK